MDRKNLIIAGSLTGIIIVLIIGIFTITPNILDNSADISNLTDNSTEEPLIFDNSTPKSAAISTAKLYMAAPGPWEPYTITDTHLTSDKKYWIVKMDGEISDWIITVDTKTLMSKSSFDPKWKSLDELKAQYVAWLQLMYPGLWPGTPVEVTLNGENIWKVPIYENPTGNAPKLDGYVYFDPLTGKSKGFDRDTGKEGQLMTLKELDNSENIRSNYGYSFKDALRNLYPE